MICLFEFCVSWRNILVMYNLIPKKYGEPAICGRTGQPTEIWSEEQHKWIGNPKHLNYWKNKFLVEKVKTPEQEAEEIIDGMDKWLAKKEGCK